MTQPEWSTSTKSDTYGASADTERHDVCDRGDCDGDSGVLHGEGDLLLDGADLLAVPLLDVAHALQDHEHVVDADT